MLAIICGGRDFVPSEKDREWLIAVLIHYKVTGINCGMAKGADLFGKEVAEFLGLTVHKFPANWDKFGKSAGFKRNLQMARTANICIAFPGGEGTNHMISICHAKYISVIQKGWFHV